ncbi:ATP-binding protein, partial [Patescibacteria group bacterium]|nr:ATP-binding protein [Patescibacteria group bacterium]
MGFRGFNKECSINLDADVVLIYGLNGTGKSSFTEALEWLFFGDISRRKLSPCRSEYQYEDYLRNLFYNGPENPFVEVEGELDGNVAKIRKELITEKQAKHYINGHEVDNLSQLPLNMESYSRPMLAQTEIAALVNTEQKDRWEQLSYILGQEDLSRLRQHLIELRNAKKDNVYKESETEFNGILIDIRKKVELSGLVSTFENCDKNAIVGFLEALIRKEGIDVSPGDYSTGVKIKLKRILGGDVAKRVIDLKIGSQADFISLTEQIKSTF